MRLIIAGGRDFDDYDLLKKEVTAYISFYGHSSMFMDELEIVSGCARGADKLGERYAKELNIPIKEFPADWDYYGLSAGFIRNLQMAKYATHCIVFWNGESKGSLNMIKNASSRNLNVKVVIY